MNENIHQFIAVARHYLFGFGAADQTLAAAPACCGQAH